MSLLLHRSDFFITKFVCAYVHACVCLRTTSTLHLYTHSFLAANDATLSITNGGPRMLINIEDYIIYNMQRGKEEYADFMALIELLRTSASCGGDKGPGPDMPHFHWGKAGLPSPECMDLNEELGSDRFCSFGCAVRVMDPTNKFEPKHAQVFAWNDAALDECCAIGDDGSIAFDRKKGGSCSQGCARQRATMPEEMCIYPPRHPKFRNPNAWPQIEKDA